MFSTIATYNVVCMRYVVAAPLCHVAACTNAPASNVFPTQYKVHEQYDLKVCMCVRGGLEAHSGRCLGQCHSAHSRREQGSTVGRHTSDITPEKAGKDLDFTRVLKLGAPRKAKLLEQLDRDVKVCDLVCFVCDGEGVREMGVVCACVCVRAHEQRQFLESHNVCDYSLLVGIHFLDESDAMPLPGSYDADRSCFKVRCAACPRSPRPPLAAWLLLRNTNTPCSRRTLVA